MNRHARKFWDELFNEHINMPGFPGLIVTRARARQWFRDLGWNLDQRTREGQSVDRMTFLTPQVDEPLTDAETCERLLAAMAEMERGRE